MQFQLIAAGMPRTGTTSLKAVFQTLGFGPCMHMEDLFRDGRRVDYWVELFERGTTDFPALFDGYRSATDFPGCLLYTELLEQYPDLKVVLNYRDPDSWYDSMLKTVYPAATKTGEEKLELAKKGEEEPRFKQIAKTLSLVETYLLDGYFEGNFLDREFAQDKYRAHYAAVRAAIPPAQLLEYRVEEGWEPLCEFLGVPVPTEEYPRKNTRDDFRNGVGKMISGGAELKIS